MHLYLTLLKHCLLITAETDFKNRPQTHKSVQPPSRPPRKKDRNRKSTLFLSAIEEDQNRYDVPPKEDAVDHDAEAKKSTVSIRPTYVEKAWGRCYKNKRNFSNLSQNKASYAQKHYPVANPSTFEFTYSYNASVVVS
jgi:hypothetical protein